MAAFLVLLVLLVFACVIWVLFAAADKIRREQAMREWWEHPPDQTDEEGDHADG